MQPTLAKPVAADIAGLPDIARSRLRPLGDLAAEKHAAVLVASDRANQQRFRQQDAEGAERRLMSTHRLREDTNNAEVARLREAAASALAEAQRLEAIRDQKGEEWQAVNRILTACETWVINLAGGHDFEVVAVDIEAKKNETTAAVLDRIQRRGRELQADLHRTRSSPYPSADAKARAAKTITALAEAGAPTFGNLIEHLDSAITFPTKTVNALVRNVPDAQGAVTFVEMTDVPAVLAWLHRDAMIAAAYREIDEAADDPNALSDAERKRRETQLLADALHCDRIIAELCWRAADDGTPLVIPPGLASEAVLGIKAVPKVAQEAEPYRKQGWRVWPLGTE